MNKRTGLFFVFLGLGIINSNCSLRSSSPMSLTTKEEDQQVPTLRTDQLSYKIINEQILSKNCTICHSSESTDEDAKEIDLTTYSGVLEHLAKVREEVVGGDMPPMEDRPDLKLTDAQLKALVDWIDNGAKETPDSAPYQPVQPPPPPLVVQPPTTTPPVLPPPPTIQIYFAEVFEKVIKTNCLKCHDSKTEKGDVNLETYDNVFLNRVEVQHDIEKNLMPVKPPRGTPLTPVQKKLILDWLNSGAPEKAGP